jgi:uncharacterized protein YcnI
MRKNAFLIFAALALLHVPYAAAHAEITPSKVSAGSVTTIVLRIEGEESVPAVKVAVQLPSNVSDVSFVPAPGWKRTVKGRVVTWSGGEITEGKFGRFVFSAKMPGAAGTEVLFPTVQTYANGKVVHWIGEETSDTPAPRIRLMATKVAPPPLPVTTTAATPSDDDGGGGAVLWIVVAAVALALGAIGLLFRRRRA